MQEERAEYCKHWPCHVKQKIWLTCSSYKNPKRQDLKMYSRLFFLYKNIKYLVERRKNLRSFGNNMVDVFSSAFISLLSSVQTYQQTSICLWQASTQFVCTFAPPFSSHFVQVQLKTSVQFLFALTSKCSAFRIPVGSEQEGREISDLPKYLYLGAIENLSLIEGFKSQ